MPGVQQRRDADAGRDRLTVTLDPEAGALALDEREVLARFAQRVPLRGSVVVEVGGCMPADAVRAAGVARWLAVDPVNDPATARPPVAAVGGCASTIPLEDSSADAAFSCNAFQHVGPLEDVLDELHRVLRPGGRVYASFGPVWSAPDGSHVENLVVGGQRYDFWTSSLLPAWAHLVLAPDELEEMVRDRHGPQLATALAAWVSESEWINRLPLHRLLEIVDARELELEAVRGCREFGYDFAPPDIQSPWSERLAPAAVAAHAWAAYGIPAEHLPIRDVELELRCP